MTAEGLDPSYAERLDRRVADAGGEQSGAEDQRPCVLVVDDEPEIVASVEALLSRDYRVLTAGSADEALALIGENQIGVILTDQRMPGGTGADLLARTLAIAPETTRILFTGYSDISAIIEAVNHGEVYYYLAKPWDPEQLLAIVRRGVERYELVFENRHLVEELSDAYEQLAAANAELREYAYSLAHDLRAPLRALDGFSFAVIEEYSDRLDRTGREYLSRIRAASQRMADLFDAQSALFVSGHLPVERAVVDVSALALGIATELAEANADRRVEVAIAEGMEAVTDAAIARLVLERLLDNAWKFTSRREVAHVEVGCVEDAGERVFFVRDDGAGFDGAYTDRLFAPFERLHSQEEFAGVGIGLATVRRMLERVGGRCWAVGECDRGAIIWFTLAGAT